MAPILELSSLERRPVLPLQLAPASTCYSSLLRARRGIPGTGQRMVASPPTREAADTYFRTQLTAGDDYRVA
ncbi:unnamed protein product [Diplocarpon coronariae]|uniref:Uncharacterized protein n=1 Tax=Diplocarpon coronariae TaxID=2795749 RepID=A0A218Z5Y7_9HELO|nr:hypothetical protein JHW43_002215 [Diplocarpon mali]OWP02933.1 hypothetical protein B2J93_3513 [Marssonina coronariae]